MKTNQLRFFQFQIWDRLSRILILNRFYVWIIRGTELQGGDLEYYRFESDEENNDYYLNLRKSGASGMKKTYEQEIEFLKKDIQGIITLSSKASVNNGESIDYLGYEFGRINYVLNLVLSWCEKISERDGRPKIINELTRAGIYNHFGGKRLVKKGFFRTDSISKNEAWNVVISNVERILMQMENDKKLSESLKALLVEDKDIPLNDLRMMDELKVVP